MPHERRGPQPLHVRVSALDTGMALKHVDIVTAAFEHSAAERRWAEK